MRGGVKVIVACPFPLVAVIPVGAFGTVAGVMELLDIELALVPILFVAVTVKVYATPFVSPVTVIHDVVPVAKCPSFDVTVYWVIAEPLSAGMSNVIVACPLPRVAWIFVGTSGTRAGITGLLIEETALVPSALTAETRKV